MGGGRAGMGPGLRGSRVSYHKTDRQTDTQTQWKALTSHKLRMRVVKAK